MEIFEVKDDFKVWRKKRAYDAPKELALKEAINVIENSPLHCFSIDAYPYYNAFNQKDISKEMRLESPLDTILQIAVESCKLIHKTPYNEISIESWINRVQSKNPIQSNYKHETDIEINKYHNHVEISKGKDFFIPDLTFVYYIQMPETMEGDDGVLYFKGKLSGEEYFIKPEEGDLIIMEGDIDHAPNFAPNSELDRIVLAGNVGFH